MSFVEIHPVHTTEKARKETTTLESIGKIVDHIDAEALPLSTSNTGRIVGMVMGGILAAVVVTALVGSEFINVFLSAVCFRLYLCFTASCIPRS